MATGSELFSYAIFVCTLKYLFTSRDGRDHCTGMQNVHFWLKTVAFSSSIEGGERGSCIQGSNFIKGNQMYDHSSILIQVSYSSFQFHNHCTVIL